MLDADAFQVLRPVLLLHDLTLLVPKVYDKVIWEFQSYLMLSEDAIERATIERSWRDQ